MSIDKLKAAVCATWDEHNIVDINKHIFGMPDRVRAIVKAQIGYTSYNFLIIYTCSSSIY